MSDLLAKPMRHLGPALLAAYAIMGIATFGHAAADEPLECPPERRYCLQSDMRAGAVALGFIAGAAWPLYWSWEVWS